MQFNEWTQKGSDTLEARTTPQTQFKSQLAACYVARRRLPTWMTFDTDDTSNTHGVEEPIPLLAAWSVEGANPAI